jgi:hypothetical protein
MGMNFSMTREVATAPLLAAANEGDLEMAQGLYLRRRTTPRGTGQPDGVLHAATVPQLATCGLQCFFIRAHVDLACSGSST